MMYRQLQNQVREYIIKRLNNNEDVLEFDIDVSDFNRIGIICHSQKESVRMVIGETQMPDYISKCVQHILKPFNKNSNRHEWLYLVRYLLKDVFKMYGFDIEVYPIICAKYKIMGIFSYVFGGYNTKTGCADIVGTFADADMDNLLNRLLGSQLLLILLDPIQYFYCCSLVIQESNQHLGHTKGIYELFLKKFPEKSSTLFRDYLMACLIFEPYCRDIVFLVFVKLLNLWVPSLDKN